MISSLHIENIAVIKNADVGFKEGFTVLTGETGAGKSIVIDSINLILGSRAQKDIIRSGESGAMVSAVFAGLPERVTEALSELGILPDDDGFLMIQRNIYSDGRGVIRIGGRQITASVERDAAKMLVNIHGQHDNQALLEPENHINFLDAYASDSDLLEEYYALYKQVGAVKKKLSELSRDEKEKARMTELLKYQIADIDSGHLKPGEEEALLEKKKKIQNLEKISKQCGTVYRALYQNEKGVSAYELAAKAETALRMIAEVIPEAAQRAERLGELKYELSEIADFAESNLISTESGDPTELLDKIESRLEQISKLKRKYGATIGEILEYRKKSAEELDEIVMSDELSEKLTAELENNTKAALDCAKKLSEARKSAAMLLEENITKELRFLDMGKVGFFVKITDSVNPNPATTDGIPAEKKRLTQKGTDEVEFLISTNPGEPAKPLVKIASGGELSRIMLAVKCVFADKDGIPTLIFDEIDTGVSGKTLQKIGLKLKQLSRAAQVICVTHSAQIASLADNHLCITKREVGERVETGIELLSREGRIHEVARIMGGETITETLLKTAEELICEGERLGTG